MDKLIEEITKLTAEWHRLIGPEHHKDRDCHWSIDTIWSYGDRPFYLVKHYGYILDHLEIKFDSYEEALHQLKNIIEQAIKNEKNAQAEEQSF